MEDAKDVFSASEKQFMLSMISLSNALEEPKTSCTILKDRFEEVKRYWNEVQDAHDSYAQFTSSTMDTEEWSLHASWINQLADDFDTIEIRTDKLMHVKPTQEVSI